ncbi:MAG: hypothetical protein KA498_02795 [Neisseriaceae bacterium]|nr:hypothetical protein [Neisseriaceae bacterium]
MNGLKPWGVGLVLLLLGVSVQAAGVTVCYGYGCRQQAQVRILPEEALRLSAYFTTVQNAADERQAMALAVQDLYQIAAQYTPIHQDKGRNVADGTAAGRMDCADHSQTDTEFLAYLKRQGWLRFHEVLQPAYRAPKFFDLHYASQVQEQSSREKWVIDSWFHDFGAPPEVVPLVQWAEGWSPD